MNGKVEETTWRIDDDELPWLAMFLGLLVGRKVDEEVRRENEWVLFEKNVLYFKIII